MVVSEAMLHHVFHTIKDGWIDAVHHVSDIDKYHPTSNPRTSHSKLVLNNVISQTIDYTPTTSRLLQLIHLCLQIWCVVVARSTHLLDLRLALLCRLLVVGSLNEQAMNKQSANRVQTPTT